MRKASGIALLALGAMALSQSPALGATATATISSQPVAGNAFQYDIKLTNTGSTPIGTLWFGWVPGYDLLRSPATNVASPAGWSGANIPDSGGPGSAQWVATTPLAVGQSLDGFMFTSTDTPAQIAGISPFDPLDPSILEGASFVYSGAPFSDAGFELVPSAVSTPEPGSLALLLGLPALLVRRKRR